jgi:hypothetical protein
MKLELKQVYFFHNLTKIKLVSYYRENIKIRTPLGIIYIWQHNKKNYDVYACTHHDKFSHACKYNGNFLVNM